MEEVREKRRAFARQQPRSLADAASVLVQKEAAAMFIQKVRRRRAHEAGKVVAGL